MAFLLILFFHTFIILFLYLFLNIGTYARIAEMITARSVGPKKIEFMFTVTWYTIKPTNHANMFQYQILGLSFSSFER